MSDSFQIAIRRCKSIKRLLFLLCRFPAFTGDFIRKHIEKPGTEQAELEDYQANRANRKPFRSFLLVAIYSAWTLRNAYALSTWLAALESKDELAKFPQTALGQQQLPSLVSANSTRIRRVTCLLTNCTRLGPLDLDYGNSFPEGSHERLFDDISRLPLGALCDPSLGHILFDPVMTLDALGIFTYAIAMYAHMLLGAWTTIQQWLSPAANEAISFVTSPKVTMDMKRTRARELLSDLARSYHNFQPPFALLVNPCRVLGHSDSKSPFKLAEDSRETQEQRVSNCVPVIRTEWWRGRLACLFISTLIGDLAALLELAGLALGFLVVKLGRRTQLYGQFQAQMDAMNCYIWPERVTELSLDAALRTAEMEPDRTSPWLMGAISLSLLAGFSVALMMDYYWCIVQDLAVWLAEFRMLMVASLVATRFQHRRERRHFELEVQMNYELLANAYEADALDKESGRFSKLQNWMSQSMDGELLQAESIGQHHYIDTRHFYKIPELRQQFQESIIVKAAWIFERIEKVDKWRYSALKSAMKLADAQDEKKRRHFRWHRINSTHKDRDHSERFLAQILFPLWPAQMQTGLPAEDFDRTHYDIDTMEQIYVNFRLLCEHVREQPLTLIISITYLLNYGLVIICVVVHRQFPSLERETMIIITFACIVANYLIVLAADFHAQARKLQPLLWSLIAQLTFSKNLRAQHLRSLWLKFVANLDEEGGLAMRAFGLRVSYIFIIQLNLWTTTILSLALKPHAFEL